MECRKFGSLLSSNENMIRVVSDDFSLGSTMATFFVLHIVPGIAAYGFPTPLIVQGVSEALNNVILTIEA